MGSATHAARKDFALIETVVRKCYGPETPEQRAAGGEFAVIVGVVDEPTYILAGLDGKQYSWCQSLTRSATSEETVAYWRDRAKRAEERIDMIINPQNHPTMGVGGFIVE